VSGGIEGLIHYLALPTRAQSALVPIQACPLSLGKLGPTPVSSVIRASA
jgi:hypothetical protein